MNDRPSNSWLLQVTQHELAVTRAALQAVLDVLPDKFRPEPCWRWCWNELDDAAQEEVKAAREKARRALTVTRMEWREAELDKPI